MDSPSQSYGAAGTNEHEIDETTPPLEFKPSPLIIDANSPDSRAF
jgi:hypothetical protein